MLLLFKLGSRPTTNPVKFASLTSPISFWKSNRPNALEGSRWREPRNDRVCFYTPMGWQGIDIQIIILYTLKGNYGRAGEMKGTSRFS